MNRPGLLDDLRDAVGVAQVVVDADLRAPHETDWTGRFHGRCCAVVRPASTEEVAAVVECCRRHGTALVPQGGNTGLVGGAVPDAAGEADAIVLDMRRFDAIDPVDTTARQVTVGAGVRLAAVHAAAARHGLRYAVDFGARDTATIGGTIATNAGGINVVRFGPTRQHLAGVEAVLGSGHVVRRLGGLVKDNTGFDLAGLLCGSEGTLGIVTRARLRLVPAHRRRVTALAAFTGMDAAVDATVRMRDTLESLEAAEVMFADGVDMVCRTFGDALPFSGRHPVYALFEAAADDDPTAALGAVLEQVHGLADVAVDVDGSRRDRLWALREGHTLALRSLGPTVKLDITVPLSRLTEFVADIRARVHHVDPGATTWLFGHLGDGNLHVNITGAGPDEESLADAVLRRVVDLGGSISAEHGIGRAKAAWLALDRGHADVAAMALVKHALDPDGILNPGVLLADYRRRP